MLPATVSDPIRSDSSSFVLRCLDGADVDRTLPVLDIPCGRGRHARVLASLGLNVVGSDIDAGRLAETRATAPVVKADALAGLPFRSRSFGLVLVVHFTGAGLVAAVADLVAPGGYLLFETFGFNGDNWKQLPLAGEVLRDVGSGFEVLKYHERKSPNLDVGSVSVKLFAKRRA